ncbi:MAG: hypothetical protein KDA80_08070 [Planctomycetaceae bacterium]|nr:hypothetical protein [Planctomycetaceae bacterium]
MAEPELSILTRQSLGERIQSEAKIISRTKVWESRRISTQTGIDWQFTTEDARIELKRLSDIVKSDQWGRHSACHVFCCAFRKLEADVTIIASQNPAVICYYPQTMS